MMKERALESGRSTSKDEDHHGYERSYDQRVTIDHERCIRYGTTRKSVQSKVRDLPQKE